MSGEKFRLTGQWMFMVLGASAVGFWNLMLAPLDPLGNGRGAGWAGRQSTCNDGVESECLI